MSNRRHRHRKPWPWTKLVRTSSASKHQPNRRIIAKGQQADREIELHATKGYRNRRV